MVNLIFQYFDHLDEKQKNQFAQLESIYKYWNQQINVISRKDIENLYLHHVLHSLSISKFVDLGTANRIMDYGSGGGFPGIPLAILYPSCQFDLVDSVGKKLVVVQEVAKELGLKNIKTIHDRVENIYRNYNYVVSRAVAKPDILWGNVNKNLVLKNTTKKANGLLILRGNEEIEKLPTDVKIKIWKLSEVYTQDYFKAKTLVLLSKSITINNNGKS